MTTTKKNNARRISFSLRLVNLTSRKNIRRIFTNVTALMHCGTDIYASDFGVKRSRLRYDGKNVVERAL